MLSRSWPSAGTLYLSLKKQSAQYLVLLSTNSHFSKKKKKVPIPKQSLSSQKTTTPPKSTVREIVRNGTSRRRKMRIKIPSISVQAVLYPDRLHELPLPFSQQRRRLHARKPHWSLSLSLNLYILALIKHVLSVCLLRKPSKTNDNKIWVLFTLSFWGCFLLA